MHRRPFHAHLDEQEVLLHGLLVALVVQSRQRLVWMVLQRLLPIGCAQYQAGLSSLDPLAIKEVGTCATVQAAICTMFVYLMYLKARKR